MHCSIPMSGLTADICLWHGTLPCKGSRNSDTQPTYFPERCPACTNNIRNRPERALHPRATLGCSGHRACTLGTSRRHRLPLCALDSPCRQDILGRCTWHKAMGPDRNVARPPNIWHISLPGCDLEGCASGAWSLQVIQQVEKRRREFLLGREGLRLRAKQRRLRVRKVASGGSS